MQHKPFNPPLAHKVRIPHPYTPAAGTDVRDTFARARGIQTAQRKARRVATTPTTRAQPDLFTPSATAADQPAFATFLIREAA
ncbi:MAG: hypothetical protein GAK30_01549 [Paracidovorax wautersii]|uniref:Uncharacterized protein n=1 Tax=Paracidovorax wautersii TaxID=1177982 RepID=A0A7V8FPP9_9BURK|nr:MAG: hypothetical protein GAK30_01549 [Paracidovorax wautersii]